MKVVLSDQAEADLETIADWIAKDSPRRAVAFVGELKARCGALARFPARYPVIVKRNARAIRRCVHRNHLILFEFDGAADVMVVRILHGAQDYLALLDATSTVNEDG